MSTVVVRILHLAPAEHTGPLAGLVAEARGLVARDLAARFGTAGVADVEVVPVARDGRTFGSRLRELATGIEGGMIVLGSGSIPLAGDEDIRRLIEVAASGRPIGLTNNWFSGDVVAVGDARVFEALPDLAADNALPRWLATQARIAVEVLAGGARLGLDVDSPIDLELLRRHPSCPPALAALAASVADLLAPAAAALDGLHALALDPSAELLVAGRLSASGLAVLEGATRCRVRAFVEERGLRAGAAYPGPSPSRPPASIVGLVLERDGPASIAGVIGRLADGAVIDTRVLLAHRLGADEAAWPSPEDRFASDLLLEDRIADPWLRELTSAAASGPLPIALGGHTLVGPGLALALRLADAMTV